MFRPLSILWMFSLAGLAMGAPAALDALAGIRADLASIQGLHAQAVQRDDARAARCVQDHVVVTRSILDAAERADALQVSALAVGNTAAAESYARAVEIGRTSSAEQLAEAKQCLGQALAAVTERTATADGEPEELAPLSSVLYDWPGMPCTGIASMPLDETTGYGDDAVGEPCG